MISITAKSPQNEVNKLLKMRDGTDMTTSQELNDFLTWSIPVKRVVQWHHLTDEDRRGSSHLLCCDAIPGRLRNTDKDSLCGYGALFD